MKMDLFETWKQYLKQEGYDVDGMKLLDLMELINSYKEGINEIIRNTMSTL